MYGSDWLSAVHQHDFSGNPTFQQCLFSLHLQINNVTAGLEQVCPIALCFHGDT